MAADLYAMLRAMDGNDYDVAMTFKRPNPFAERRARRLRRLLVFLSAIFFAYVIAGVTGYNLPSPLEVWDRFVTVAREIVHIPA